MKKHKLLILVAATGLLGGCAATLTPAGDVYTEALLPVDTTVIVERGPLVAYGPRPHYQPAPPPVHRGSLQPGPRFAPAPHRPGPHFKPGPGHHQPVHHYGAPGQHRSPGQHRAPGVRGPRTPHQPGAFQPNRSGAPGSQAQGKPRGPFGTAGRPQDSHGPQQNSRGPHSRGPR